MRPFPIIIIFAALVLIGLAFLPGLGIQLHPSATMPSLQVSFTWHEAPAVNIEREVTSKLEGALATLRDVDEISSVSRRGTGSITINFKKGADLEMARFEISSRIRRLYPEFPEGVTYPTLSASRVVGTSTPLLMYTIAAPGSSHDIVTYLENWVLPELSQIRGVDKANWFGANPREFQLVYNTRKMELLAITSAHINMALRDYFVDDFVGMGSITGQAEQGEAPIPVILQGLGSKNPDWGNIPVGNVEGQIIYLTDIVTVKYTERPAQSYYRINGKSTLMLTIDAEKGENQIRLANTVRARMLELQKQMPPAWQVILTWDDTDYIRKDLKRVGYRMLFSFIILMLFVALVSRDARYLMLIFITAIANLLLAVVWYHFFHIEIHLYSLAGITVSFGIIIDNSIVMIEHIRQHGNRKIFLAILAATLTTLGSLSVLFMLNAEQQAQLADFAAVVVINLALSLGVAWFLIPALLTQFRMEKSHAVTFTPRQRRKVKLSMAYLRCITFTRRYAWIVFMVLIIGFGLPLHLLPSKIEGDDKGASLYNATIGSRFYQYRIKNIAEKTLGGTFRLFSRFVYERSYFSNPERTTLYIRGQMPDGATVHQLNEAVIQMEHFLLQFKEIERFQTRVISPDYSIITIHFYPEYDRGSFPHFLQGYIIHKAISIGGAEWGVWGVGQGFSNVLSSGSGSSTIILEGYNYEQLYRYAEQLVEMAGKNPRVAKLRITGDDPWRNTNRMEFFLHTDPHKLALNGLTLSDVFAGISEKLMYRQGPVVFYNQESVPVRLISDHHLNYSLWDMENLPLFIKGTHFNTKELLSLDKREMGNDIHKHNQQYRLHVNYNFLGPHQLEERVRTQLRDQINEILPLGYKASVRTWSWQQDQKQQYLLIFLVLIIIYFICAILLESLLQPLAIIGLIPISFVGLFLTFYIFNLNFDQGGWASFILLCGLAVNAGLYILNDYNNFRNTLPGRNNLRLYVKAFQYKITPVLLTISSTLIGLIPFVVGQREAFWFAFAAGTMGGLSFSLVGIVVFFPVFLKFGSKKMKR